MTLESVLGKQSPANLGTLSRSGQIAVDLRLQALASASRWQGVFSVPFREEAVVHGVMWRIE